MSDTLIFLLCNRTIQGISNVFDFHFGSQGCTSSWKPSQVFRVTRLLTTIKEHHKRLFLMVNYFRILNFNSLKNLNLLFTCKQTLALQSFVDLYYVDRYVVVIICPGGVH